jgi:methionine synthase II (cobalamin-independent)
MGNAMTNKVVIAESSEKSKRSPNYISIYSNQSRLGITPWDISIIFATTDDFGAGKIEIEDQATIRLSPQHFKALCSSFAAVLKAYEKQFGVVNVNSDTMVSEVELSDALEKTMTAKPSSKSQTNQPVANKKAISKKV